MNLQKFIFKKVTIIKMINEKAYFYTGILKEYDEDSVIIDDIKVGELLIKRKEISEIRTKQSNK